jgi:hypothetical protein
VNVCLILSACNGRHVGSRTVLLDVERLPCPGNKNVEGSDGLNA